MIPYGMRVSRSGVAEFLRIAVHLLYFFTTTEYDTADLTKFYFSLNKRR